VHVPRETVRHQHETGATTSCSLLPVHFAAMECEKIGPHRSAQVYNRRVSEAKMEILGLTAGTTCLCGFLRAALSLHSENVFAKSGAKILVLLALTVGPHEADAATITFSGIITQSTQDGTGPAVNNPSLNNIQDLQAYTVTLAFAGSIT